MATKIRGMTKKRKSAATPAAPHRVTSAKGTRALAPRLPRLGFLGVGWIGRRRLEAIVDAGVADVVAIADPSEECLSKCAKVVPNAKRFGNLNELLEAPVDALVISTPSALHAEQTIAALERGHAVFCQKPLGRNSEEVRAIVDTARRTDRLVGVDLSYRHILGLEKIRALIRAGELGEIFAVDLVFHNAFGPQSAWFYDARLSGGGCVVDLGIHLVDAALWVLDSPVVSVSSRVLAHGHPLSLKPEAVEDFATARLDLASGAVVTLACSWRLHAGRDAVIETSFYGTKGGAALRNVNGSFHDFRAEKYFGTETTVLRQTARHLGRARGDRLDPSGRGGREVRCRSRATDRGGAGS